MSKRKFSLGTFKKYGLAVLFILITFILLYEAGFKNNFGSENRNTVLKKTMDETHAVNPLRIVATTTQAGDLTAIITQSAENIELETLMASGVDPHLYRPTQGDITRINNADLIIYNGLHLEGRFDTIFETLREQGVAVHALAQAVKMAGLVIGNFADTNSDDPHFWFDPRNWKLSTEALANFLAELYPSQAKLFRENATGYMAELDLLYDWALTSMNSVPPGQRYLVSSHDAFQYFGNTFDWNVASIQGISTQDSAGVGDIQKIVDLVIEHNIPVLFVESSIPNNTIHAVIEAIEAIGGRTRTGIHRLFSDAMGNRDSFNGTYIGMIAHNVYTVLQSYQQAGVSVDIALWPQDLNPQPPKEFLELQ